MSCSTRIRPRTSKPRGVCRYYTTTRGCFAGPTCKFLHADPDQQDLQDPQPLLTPYDHSKRCRYYANGFCRRGDSCWFKHIIDGSQKSSESHDEDAQDEPCSICFEKPTTYGLLSGCNHIFCATCIRQWRNQKGQTEHGNLKKCPMCRNPSKFITPSSRFWKHGHHEREQVTEAYKESMAKVPCRYFQRSLQGDTARPLCPFGRDCFYQHLNADGSPYIFKSGADISMRQYYNTVRPSMRSFFDDLVDFTADYVPVFVDDHDGPGIFSMQITADLSTINEPSNSSNFSRTNDLDGDAHISHLLREAMSSLGSAASDASDSVAHTLAMVRLLTRQGVRPNTEAENSTEAMMGRRILSSYSLEDRQGVTADPPPSGVEVPFPSDSADLGSLRSDEEWLRSYDVHDDMPGLQSVSNSSSSERYFSDSESDPDDDVSRLGRYLRGSGSGSLRTTVEYQESEGGGEEEVRAMQEIAERGPEEVVEVIVRDGVLDEPQMPVMDYEMPGAEGGESGRVVNPPFLTDGRGRVVWSSNGENSDSEPRPSEETTGK